MIDEKELRRRFTYHPPVHVEGKPPEEQQSKRYNLLRGSAHDYATIINHYCPDSREKSLAITKLQEVVFWANASIACNELVGDE